MTPRSPLARALADLRATVNIKHRLIALSLMRTALGAIVLALYATHLWQRPFLWGNEGVIPFASFAAQMHTQHNFSLYQLSSSPVAAAAVFYMGLAVTIAFTIGYRTRIASILFFVFTWSLNARNPFITNGGDTLLALVAFYMMFADCGACLSLDAALGRRASTERPLAALIHNCAAIAIQIQLCLVYFMAAFYKIQGQRWQDGTALYYVLREAQVDMASLNPFIYSNALLVATLSYATVFFQMAFPFLIWNRKAKPFMVLGAVSLHLAIAYTMGLVWFSAVMISVEVILFGDAELLRLAGWVQGQEAACAMPPSVWPWARNQPA